MIASIAQLLLASLLFVQEGAVEAISAPTGLEWMVIATIVAPAILLIIIIYYGSKITVS